MLQLEHFFRGIDSSLIVSILSRELSLKTQTFTIGFPNQPEDESIWAKKLQNI